MEMLSPFPSDRMHSVPKVSLHELVFLSVQKVIDKNEDREFVRDVATGEVVMYSEVEPLSRKVASALIKYGFKEHDICLMVTRNHARVFLCYLAILRLTGTIHQCYPEDNSGTLSERLKLCKSKFMFCDSESVAEVRKAAQLVDWSVNIFSMDDVDGCTSLSKLLLDGEGDDLPRVSTDIHKDTAVIFCTSGTSGICKGAAHSHYSIVYFLQQEGFFSKCRQSYVFATGKPFHISGFTITLGAAVRECSTLLASKLTPDAFFHAIHTYKPKAIISFPTYLLWTTNEPSAKKYDFSSVTVITIGGASSFLSQAEALSEAFPNMRVLNKTYGMTECCVLTTTYDLGSTSIEEYCSYKDKLHASEGYLILGAKGKVIDIETGKLLGYNQPGEICLRAPCMMTEYIGQPEKTKEILQNGWIHTGDYGYFDQDGSLYVLSRLKEVFKYWNYHISPAELENVILQHPSVADVCVIGVRDPDGGGDIPRAVVVLRVGHEKLKCEANIKAFVEDRVEKYKQLRGGIIIVDELPLGKTGKVQRVQVSKLYS